MNRLTEAIKHLIIINVILFLVPQFLKGLETERYLALWFPQNDNFGFWQYISHMFMHGGYGHILFNMYGLWAFGTPLEQIWGRNKFLFFYFSAGIGAGLIYTLVNYYQFNGIFDYLIDIGVSNTQINEIVNIRAYTNQDIINETNIILSRSTSLTEQIDAQKIIDIYNFYNKSAVGASGAVYGVLVAFGMYYKDSKLALIFFPVPIAAKYFIPVLIAIDLFFGMTRYSIGNTAHFAHVGGAIIGFLIAYYWKRNQFKRWN